MIDRFINNENLFRYRNYSLQTIRRLLKHFGSPQKSFPAIHVAGTNGKGSVAHTAAEIFTRSGYRTGLYVSPHLLKVNERITIVGVPIPDNVMASYVNELELFLKRDKSPIPTYFDVLTLCAFRHFHDNAVDMAVIETGLGGRLDSTNIIRPLCSVITDIDFDHMGILGDDLASIAREKAGIIKKGVPVITSNTRDPVLPVLEHRAASMKSPLLVLDRDFAFGDARRTGNKTAFTFRGMHGLVSRTMNAITIPPLPLLQLKNLTTAIAAVLAVSSGFPGITEESIKKALGGMVIPGRFETLHERPRVIFDPAHNFQAVAAVIEEASGRFNSKNLVVALSMMADKDYGRIIEWLISKDISLVYYNLPGPRSFRIEGDGTAPWPVDTAATIPDLYRAVSPGKDSCLLFTGSFRLYGTAREFTLYGNLKGWKKP